MPDHPEGPGTLWTQVRDTLPLTEETVARGLTLEAGRHPPVSELRAALGLDVDFDGVPAAARSVRLPREEPPSDELLIEFIDAMYRAVRSPRLVRATLSDAGLALERDGDIRLRAGERLKLLVMFDNATAHETACLAGVGATTSDVVAEPGRVASVLVDAGEVDVATTEVVLTANAAGYSGDLGIPVRVARSWTFSADLIDDEVGAPTPARIYLTDALGAAWPDDVIVRRDEHGNAFFHADGAFEARVSGDVTLIATRGMEYEPTEVAIAAPGRDMRAETVRLRRWSHMARDGWYSADVHVHLHYGGEYELDPEHASLVQRGEDVNFMNMMVANQGSFYVHDRAYFEGKPHKLSDAEHILRWGEEYRNDFYGHLCMYGITDLVPPIYSGFRLSEHPHDLPANALGADRCHEAGGTLSYAHPLFASGDLDRVFAEEHRRSVEAKELPVDVALGKIDALDVMSYPSIDLETSELWYKLLNCGFRLPATAGTDTFMNFAGTGIFSNPPAGNRVFARVDGEFTTESWCDAVRAGRTFVTNGPMLSLDVAGQPQGATIDAAPGDTLTVRAEARSHQPMDRIELIVNGDIVATEPATANGRLATVDTGVQIETDGWIAVRALGPAGPHILGGPLFAHASPVYITAGVANLKRGAAAAYFVDWIERLVAMCHEHGRYPSDATRDEVIALFRQGQDYYSELAG